MRRNGDSVEIEIVFGQGVDWRGLAVRGWGGGGHGYIGATQLDLPERLPAVIGGKRLVNGGGDG